MIQPVVTQGHDLPKGNKDTQEQAIDYSREKVLFQSMQTNQQMSDPVRSVEKDMDLLLKDPFDIESVIKTEF